VRMDGCNIGEFSLARCDLHIRLYHSGGLGIFYSLRKTSVITNFFKRKKNTRRNELLDISFRILFSKNDRRQKNCLLVSSKNIHLTISLIFDWLLSLADSRGVESKRFFFCSPRDALFCDKIQSSARSR